MLCFSPATELQKYRCVDEHCGKYQYATPNFRSCSRDCFEYQFDDFEDFYVGGQIEPPPVPYPDESYFATTTFLWAGVPSKLFAEMETFLKNVPFQNRVEKKTSWMLQCEYHQNELKTEFTTHLFDPTDNSGGSQSCIVEIHRNAGDAKLFHHIVEAVRQQFKMDYAFEPQGAFEPDSPSAEPVKLFDLADSLTLSTNGLSKSSDVFEDYVTELEIILGMIKSPFRDVQTQGMKMLVCISDIDVVADVLLETKIGPRTLMEDLQIIVETHDPKEHVNLALRIRRNIMNATNNNPKDSDAFLPVRKHPPVITQQIKPQSQY